MFAKNSFVALLAFAAPFLVWADVVPTSPAPGDIFNAGSTCRVSWTGDTNSTTVWKNMAIELMTGSNFDMVHITTVATNQDGTVSGHFSYQCPDVTPNSPVYFYQLSSPQASLVAWTGRFTIASSDGKSTPPTNDTQPETGEAIPWGTGALTDPSKAVAAPSFASSSGSSVSASSTASSSNANSTTRAVTPTSAPPVLSSAMTAVVTSSVITTTDSSLGPTTTNQANGALGAMTGFDVQVWGAAAAALVISFVW